MTADAYAARRWPMRPGTINQWGGPPPPRFLPTGFPIAATRAGRPTRAMATTGTPATPLG